MLKQNTLADATTEQGFPTEVGLPVQREVELEDGTKVIVESVVPEVMAQTLKSHFVTPGEKYVDNGNNLNGVVQNYNENKGGEDEGGGEDEEIIITDLEIEVPPTKVVYLQGDIFNPDGMVVKANYSDGSSEEIYDYTYEPFAPAEGLTLDDTYITITYEGFTVLQPITVVSDENLPYTITVRSNIYACGVLLINITTGETLFNNTIEEETSIDCSNVEIGNDLQITVYSNGYENWEESFVYTGNNDFTAELEETPAPDEDLSSILTISSNIYPCHVHIEEVSTTEPILDEDIEETKVIDCGTDKIGTDLYIEITAEGYNTYSNNFTLGLPEDNYFDVYLDIEPTTEGE